MVDMQVKVVLDGHANRSNVAIISGTGLIMPARSMGNVSQ